MFTIEQKQSKTLLKNIKEKLKKVLDDTENYIQTSKDKSLKPIVIMSDIVEKVP